MPRGDPRLHGLGIRRDPERERDEGLIDRIEQAVIGRSDRRRSAQVANLDVEEG